MSTPPDAAPAASGAPGSYPGTEPIDAAPEWDGGGWTPFSRSVPEPRAGEDSTLAAPTPGVADAPPVPASIDAPTKPRGGRRRAGKSGSTPDGPPAPPLPVAAPSPPRPPIPPTFAKPGSGSGPVASPPATKPAEPPAVEAEPPTTTVSTAPSATTEVVPAPTYAAKGVGVTAEQLRRAAAEPAPEATYVRPAASPGDASPGHQGKAVLPTSDKQSRPALLVALVGVLVVALAAGLGGLYLQRGHAKSAAVAQAKAAHVVAPPGLLIAPGRAAGKTGPLLTPTEARRVLLTLWNAREAAVGHNDTQGIAALESLVALTNDNAVARCRCAPARAGLYTNSSIWVARQTAYPVVFTAQVSTTQDAKPYTEVLVMRRASATQPWKLILDTGWAQALARSAALDLPVVDAEGYAVNPPEAGRVRGLSAPDALASYWRLAKSIGKVQPTTTFRPGTWTTLRAKSLAKHPDGKRQDNGYPAAFGFLVDPQAGTYVMRTTSGVLSCSAVGVVAKYTSWPKQDAERQAWGPDVKPGPHRRIVSLETWQTCFRIPAGAERSNPIEVLGGDGSRAPVRLA